MIDLSAARLSLLVERIYEAGLEPGKWQAFVQEFAASFERAYVVLHGLDYAAGTALGLVAATYEPAHLETYARYYAGKNLWAAQPAYHRVGPATTSEQLLPRDDLVRTEFYNDWLRPQEDIGTGAGITLFRDGNRLLRLSANIRIRDAARQAQLVATLDRLAPHLRQAVQLTRRLSGATTATEFDQSFGHIAAGVVLTDRRGRVIHMNASGRHMLEHGDAFSLAANGTIQPADPRAAAKFSQAIAAIAHRRFAELPGSIRVTNSRGATVCEMLVTPYRHHGLEVSEDFVTFALDDLPVAVITLTEVPPAQSEAAILAAQYGLTRSEAALALGLAAGQTPRQLADERQVSIHTVRNQMKSIFTKTAVGRQSALVALLAGDLAKRER